MDYFKILIFFISVNIVLAVHTSDTIYCTEKYESENCTSDIPLNVKTLVNRHTFTDINSPITYDEIDFCQSENNRVLTDNLFLPLPLDIKFLKPQKCAVICTKTYVGGLKDDEAKLRIMKDAILSNYRHYWRVGDISVLWIYNKDGKMVFDTGFPMGFYFNKEYNNSNMWDISNIQTDKGYYLFNHVNIKITFQSKEKITSGFSHDGVKGKIKNAKIIPKSIRHQDPFNPDCKSEEPLYLSEESRIQNGQAFKIVYSYTVFFEMDNYVPSKSNETDLQEPDMARGDSSVPSINLILMTCSLIASVTVIYSKAM